MARHSPERAHPAILLLPVQQVGRRQGEAAGPALQPAALLLSEDLFQLPPQLQALFTRPKVHAAPSARRPLGRRR